MRLNTITLTNFRQFKGVQTFDLRSDSLKPVSLLFGANGAGKTTFLNAFTWVLYATMSEDVEQQERLVTDSVWRALPMGDSVEVGVELTFDHEGRHYRAARRTRVRKESDQQRPVSADVELWTTNPDGSSKRVDAPQEAIYAVLPRAVSRFFFFNGERIENLVKKGAYREVQQDIKVLLDLEQVERALVHLPKLDRRLSQDLKKYGGDKASEIQTAIDGLHDREAELRDELTVLEGDLATLTEERESVNGLLRQHSAVAPIQERRDEVSNELEEARAALKEAEDERARMVATRGFLAFTETLCKTTADIADSLYQKGTLPAPLKREFVEKLLHDKTCICGTELTKHSEPWQHVQQWRQRAGLQAVETAWQRLNGQMAPMPAARLNLRDDLAQLLKRINEQRDRVTQLEATKSELDGKLRDNPQEDVQDLERKRIDLDLRIKTKTERKGAVAKELAEVNKDLEKRKKDRSKAEVTDELAAKARARSDLVQSVQRALKEILAIRSENMRKRLDAELKSVFRSITHQNHIPTLNEDFELTLHKDENGVQLLVPKSTGENQILSLSFVAAVSKLARELRKERRAEGQAPDDAGTYPIVMDAAFGSLDHDYQQAVSRALAQMAPQLVVLVSKSQGLGKVVSELNPYISHLGIIESHTTKEGATADDIELRGMSHPYIRPDQTDHSELKVAK